MDGAVRFVLGLDAHEARGLPPTTTVLAYLRDHCRRVGTKEGCAEGDCGACTVVLGEVDGDGGAIRYRAVNSCIQFLPQLHGKQLITVEDLRGADGALHPVQQAMVEEHASQCGFCTPGFVMSLFALLHDAGAGGRAAVDDALAGNLCRCTGYAPIIRAAQKILARRGADKFDAAHKTTVKKLRAANDGETPTIRCNGQSYFAPRTLRGLLQLRARHADAVLVAGATDAGLWVTKQLRRFGAVLDTGRVAELRRLRERDGVLEIGAAVTYRDAAAALTRHYPALGELLRRLGSVQVRNAGTIGGNIANGSPIGDMPPPLIAAGGRVALRSVRGAREIALEDFFTGYGRQDLRADEVLEKILLPLPPAGLRFNVYKLSKRFDQDISIVCGAFALRLQKEKVAAIRIAYGGMAGVPKRARRTERALAGKTWNESTVAAAAAALEQEYTPLSDLRGSAAYRTLAAKNLLHRFYSDTTGGDVVNLARPLQ